MKPLTLSKAFAAIAVICFVTIAALWVANAQRFILGQLVDGPDGWRIGDNPVDWRMILAPRAYLLALYLLEACALISAVWFRVRGRRKPLTDYILVLAAPAGVVAVTLVLLFHRPPMPAGWSKLRAGMTQKEVQSLVGGEAVLRLEQRVRLEHRSPMLGAEGPWELELEYDGPGWKSVRYGSGHYGNARLTHATATCAHRFRLLCSQPRELP